MPEATGLHQLESVHSVAPLGLRFWDAATDTPVCSGLRVVAYPPWVERGPTMARRSPSGFYGLFGLPGMHAQEYPNGASLAATSPPSSPSTFIVCVDDPGRRFLPIVFGVSLPLQGQLPLPLRATSASGAVVNPYLFSAPSRPVLTGFAAIRADLWDRERDAPASHAVLHVSAAGREATGIADRLGRVLVLLSPPPPESLSLGSPPGAGQGHVVDEYQPLTATAQYEPGRLRMPLEGRASAGIWGEVPALKSVLEAQGFATFWIASDPGQPLQQVATMTGEFAHGRALVLYSNDQKPETHNCRLLISAAGA
ncbi:MAG: hypothetical protein JW940_19985 [Polyangiaceae bacterium]|nr:hypothetical protein [Polyangiaceae bacterium]